MTDIENHIRTVLRCEADAMRVPDARPGERVARVVYLPVPRRRARVAMAAAAAVLVVAGGVVLAQRRAEPGPAASNIPALPAFHFETPTVLLDADSVEVIAADRTWVPTVDLIVHGDPGLPNEYTTLELTWHDGGIEQRINMYFTSDGVDWWANEIRTYDGQGDWFEPVAAGEYFRSPLGTAFIGDLDLPNLRIHSMTIEAFRRPAICDNPTAPISLLADFPVIDAGVGGFVASFQMVDTATCASLPVAAYTFEYTTADPTIVAIDPPEVIPEYPAIKTRVGLELLTPGTTTVYATAKNGAGEVVDTAEMQVRVQPPSDDLATEEDTATIDTVAVSQDDPAIDQLRRVGYLDAPLAALGYSVEYVETPLNHPAVVTARSTDRQPDHDDHDDTRHATRSREPQPGANRDHRTDR